MPTRTDSGSPLLPKRDFYFDLSKSKFVCIQKRNSTETKLQLLFLVMKITPLSTFVLLGRWTWTVLNEALVGQLVRVRHDFIVVHLVGGHFVSP